MVEKTVGYTESSRYASLDDLRQSNEYNTTSAICLDYCGRENCMPGFQFGPFVRNDFVIHIVLGGLGSYTRNGRTYPIGQNQAFLIYPDEETVYRADEKEPWSYMWIGFHGIRALEFTEDMGFQREMPVVDLKQTDRLKTCIERMLDARQLTRVNELRRTSELLQMIAVFMEQNDAMHTGNVHEYPGTVYVHSAMDYMQYHMQEKIKMDALAELIGISRSHLTNSFQKELKMSPQEYLIHLRMERAASMLKKTSDPINLVAAACGYEDSLSFSKAFKLRYHMSPRDYRNQKIELVTKKEKGSYTPQTQL